MWYQIFSVKGLLLIFMWQIVADVKVVIKQGEHNSLTAMLRCKKHKTNTWLSTMHIYIHKQ